MPPKVVGLVIAGVVVVIALLAVAISTTTHHDAQVSANGPDDTAASSAFESHTRGTAPGAIEGNEGATSRSAGDAADAGGGTGALLDATIASKAAADLWPQRLAAISARDADALAKVETGAARDWDTQCITICDAAYLAQKFVPGKQKAAVVAPPQTDYPLYFVAQEFYRCDCDTSGAGGNRDLTDLVVYTKQAATESWKVAIDTSFEGSSPIIGAPGYTSFRVAIPDLPVDIRALPAQLADLWQVWRQTGAPPSATPFHIARDDMTGIGEALAHARTSNAAAGYTSSVAYRSGVDDDGFFPAMLAADTVVACSTVRWTSTVQAGARGPVTQSADQKDFGKLVPPGSYQRVDRSGVRASCFLLTQSCRCLETLGQDGGDYSYQTS